MSEQESNPFQAPIKASKETSAEATNNAGLDFIAIAKKWERYRLIYNGILVVETIVLSILGVDLVGPQIIVELAAVAGFGAVVFNFFFFLGPALDGYIQWISNSQGQTGGWIIFILGTLFSMMLAGYAIASVAAGVPFP